MILSLFRKLFVLSTFILILFYFSPRVIDYYGNLKGPLPKDIYFYIEKNESLKSISRKLKKFGVIHNRVLFLVYIKVKGSEKKIRFGEYLIKRNINAKNLLSLFTVGKQINHSLTIPEGWTSWQIVQHLNSSELFTGEVTSIPVEGSMAPDTYFISRGEDRNNTIKRMQSRQEDILLDAWTYRDPSLPLNSPRELLILASIIEKETGRSEEREIISSVLINRINKGMRLQVDPTVIYGITEGKEKFGRPLEKKDLRAKSDYNTYLLPGLPKGPICNPGKEAILAAGHPKKTDFLFFVADGTGGHVFSKNLSSHSNNVRLWREKSN